MDNENYKAVLADLRAKREKLDQLIAGLEVFSGEVGDDPPGVGAVTTGVAPAGGVKTDTFFGMKTPGAVKKYLEIKKRPEKAADIAKALEAGGFMSHAKNFYANVSTVLRRLEETGEAVRIGDTKKWAMASWYPNRPKANNSTPATETAVEDEADEDVGAGARDDTPTMKVL